MIEEVIFTPAADEDIALSYDWYEGREPGLGEEYTLQAVVVTRLPRTSYGNRVFLVQFAYNQGFALKTGCYDL